MLVKTFPGKFPGKHSVHSFTIIIFQTFIEVKTKLNGYFSWELGHIWNQTQYIAIKYTVLLKYKLLWAKCCGCSQKNRNSFATFSKSNSFARFSWICYKKSGRLFRRKGKLKNSFRVVEY